MMKTQKIVMINNGENVGTFSPLCFLENFKDDLNKTCSRCRSFDDDGHVITNLYKVLEIKMATT